jgi:hypothetical protein
LRGWGGEGRGGVGGKGGGGGRKKKEKDRKVYQLLTDFSALQILRQSLYSIKNNLKS